MKNEGAAENRAPLKIGGSRTVAKNSFLATLDLLAGYVGNLFASIAVARALGPTKLGYYNYVLWLCSITAMFTFVGAPQANRKYLAEYLSQGEFGTGRAILRATFRFQFWLGCIVVGAGLAAVFTAVPPEHRLFAALAVLSLMPSILQAIPTSANAAVEDFGANVLPSVISTMVNLAGTALTLLLDWELVGLAGSLLASRIVDSSLRYLLYRRRFAWLRAERLTPLTPELKRRVRRFFTQSVVLQALNTVVWDRSELFFLKRFCDIREVAFYSLSFNITQQLLLLPRSFAWAAGANVILRSGRDSGDAARITGVVLRYLALIALPMTFGVAALSGPAISLVYGRQYLPAIPVLTLLAVFCAAKLLILPAQDFLLASDRQDVLVKWISGAGALNIVMDFLLIPSGGAWGAAIANSVAQTVAAIGIVASTTLTLKAPLLSRGLAKIFISAAAMAIPAAVLRLTLPPLFAVIAGIPLGAALYLLLLRWTRSLENADGQRLKVTASQLPGPVRHLYRRTLRFLVPDAA